MPVIFRKINGINVRNKKSLSTYPDLEDLGQRIGNKNSLWLALKHESNILCNYKCRYTL